MLIVSAESWVGLLPDLHGYIICTTTGLKMIDFSQIKFVCTKSQGPLVGFQQNLQGYIIRKSFSGFVDSGDLDNIF